ncbi:RluA family pseudouridine synthase [Lewinella sp. 4G2]|uniref:RluA family pseudouridine synthase n=1 Tax=Lewinella sp. 4G2 TaxID=1803372 RepID=UPI0007B4B5A7|nr:RNA pseudouridine synthase [Lewinella sp. 4G2]OAV42696.1 hypothetical protein A3850_015755 [Lewinella sp. 4G2]
MPPPLSILHAGQGYVVINKTAGLTVEAYRDHDTIEARAWAHFQRPGSPKRPFVGIVHRLDRPVSGALLLARNKSTLRRLNEAFAQKKVQKTYTALTQVPLPDERGTLEHYLVKDNLEKRARVVDGPAKGAKLSRLEYELLLKEPDGYRYAVTPITGRYHQIRVQLATAGAPIVGDAKYGSPVPYLTDQIKLHASRLVFPDVDGSPVTVDCPPDW